MFPAAYKAARQIVVLHSKKDGVLGPDERFSNSWGQQIAENVSSVAISGIAGPVRKVAGDLISADDPGDEVTGLLLGAYDKKWWTFPSFLDNGFGPAIEALYRDYLPLTYDEAAETSPPGVPSQTAPAVGVAELGATGKGPPGGSRVAVAALH